MENVLFKISYPAEFHAQTAVEAAMKLRKALTIAGKSDGRHQTHYDPHARGLPAHHRQERTARQPRRPRPLRAIYGRHSAALRPAHGRRLRRRGRNDPIFRPRIDALRAKMTASKSPASRPIITILKSALSPIAFAMELNDGKILEETVEYPIGHRRRREEGFAAAGREIQRRTCSGGFLDRSRNRSSMRRSIRDRLEAMPVNEYVDLYVL